MKILSLETSCDETAAAVIEDGQKTLSNVVVSQIDIFASYGGVIPEIAARSHLEAILPIIHQTLSEAKLTWNDIDAIAVTHTPGLLGSLLIGTLTARTLAILLKKPLYPVHHLKSHIYANWLIQPNSEKSKSTPLYPEFPLISLIISGGHTQIIYMEQHNKFQIIGTTRDDAIGECFDKVAKILGLPYPGGPAIANAALGKLPSSLESHQTNAPENLTPGNPDKYPLPHPKVSDLDFSFSGLKTAVLRSVQAELKKPISFPSFELAPLLSSTQIADFSASFQKTAIEILYQKLDQAIINYPEIKSIVVSGGVSANEKLRSTFLEYYSNKLPVFFPAKKFSGDNAAMVGSAAYFEILSGVQPTDPYSLNIFPRSKIN